MPVDTSIYNNLQPVRMPSIADAQAKGMTMAQLAMQNERLGRQMAQEGRDSQLKAYKQKVSLVGNALEGMSGMTEEERAAAYPQVRQQLIQAGVANPNEVPSQYDPGLYRQTLMAWRQTPEYLERKKAELGMQKTQAEIGKLRAETRTKGSPGSGVFAKESEKRAAKTFSEMQEAGAGAQETMDLMDSALDALVTYSKNNIGGTGPVASLGGFRAYLDQETEQLDRTFKEISLQKMKKMFAGMSKAIDSDAERKFFMASQPSIENREETNASILLAAKSLALKSKAEAEAQNQYVEKFGTMTGYKSPVKGQVTTVVSPDGEMQLIPMKLKSQMAKQGFVDLDTYSKSLFDSKRQKSEEQVVYAGSGLTPERRRARIKELREKMGK